VGAAETPLNTRIHCQVATPQLPSQSAPNHIHTSVLYISSDNSRLPHPSTQNEIFVDVKVILKVYSRKTEQDEYILEL